MSALNSLPRPSLPSLRSKRVTAAARKSEPMSHYRSTTDSILDALSLNPLPYPVLLILAVVSLFLGASWWFSYESAVETAEEQVNWILFATPVLLILVARWLSSMDMDGFFALSPFERRRRTHHQPAEGSSPWGVAALIVLLLVLVQFQSIFRESWSI